MAFCFLVDFMERDRTVRSVAESLVAAGGALSHCYWIEQKIFQSLRSYLLSMEFVSCI